MRIHRWSSREGTRGIRTHARFLTGAEEHKGESEVLTVRFEGYIASGAQHGGVGLSADEDSAGIQLFAGVPHVVCGWVTVGSWPLAAWVRKRWGLSLPEVNIVDLRLHDRAVWWEVWHDKWGSKRGTPRWRRGNFHWWDWLTGRPVHGKEIVRGPEIVTVPMPEGCYQARVTLTCSTWKRPRWPWPQVVHSYNLDVISRPGPDGPYVPEDWDPSDEHTDGYIPVPGKGENAWDCGPDGIFGLSGPGRTIEDAIGQIVQSALRDRARRGASHNYAEPIT